MTIRFLLFSGNWANDGKFFLLETKESIIILAVGKGFSSVKEREEQVGRDYLKENKNKVKAIIINNTNWQNVGLIEDICSDLGSQVPLYASFHSKLILYSLFPKLKNEIKVVGKNNELKVGDFSCYFLPLSSYIIGNLAIKINYKQQYSFFFLEDFSFSTLFDNDLIFPPNFLRDFQQFLTQKNNNTYLITSCQGLHWSNNNSLFFATKNFPNLDKPLFFILYDFDWLHILELLEIMRRYKKKVRILNKSYFLLINQILAKNPLGEVIDRDKKKSENSVYLTVGNPKIIKKNLDYYLSNFPPKEKANFHFLVGIPPTIRGEEYLARIVDYLYTQSDGITNLSKKEYLSLGISFYDLGLLLKILQPDRVITLQNSYKNEKFFSHLSNIFFQVKNGCAWDFSTKKIISFKAKKILIGLEELLMRQREEIGQSGLLIIFIITEWKEEKLHLKEIKIHALALSSLLSISKLENKIKSWWATKLVSDVKKNDQSKMIKKIIERRLNDKINSYLNFEHNIELKEPLILLFSNKQKIIK